jgi:hypothetical protein
LLSCFIIAGSLFIGTDTNLIAFDHVTSLSIERGYVLERLEIVKTDGHSNIFTLKDKGQSAAEVVTTCVQNANDITAQ